MAIQKFTQDVEKYLKWATDTDGTTQQDYQEFVRNVYNLLGNVINGTRLWQPTTSYNTGQIIISPSMKVNTFARVTSGGTTGSTEPTWPAVGSTVSDGTVKYTMYPRTLDFATDSELTAGTVANKIVSPKTLKTIMDTRLSPKLNAADLTPSLLWDVLHSKGENFVPSDVTNAGWSNLGLFICDYYSKVLKNQPSQYGQLVNICANKGGSEVTQLWLEKPSGKLAYRGGNGSIVMNDTAFTYVATAPELASVKSSLESSISSVNAKAGIIAGNVSNANSWWVKIGGTIPLIIQGGKYTSAKPNAAQSYPVAFTKAVLSVVAENSIEYTTTLTAITVLDANYGVGNKKAGNFIAIGY